MANKQFLIDLTNVGASTKEAISSIAASIDGTNQKMLLDENTMTVSFAGMGSTIKVTPGTKTPASSINAAVTLTDPGDGVDFSINSNASVESLTVDASALTHQFSLKSDSRAISALTTGSANDYVSVGASLKDATQELSFGAGNDTLVFTAQGASLNADLGAGDDYVSIGNADDAGKAAITLGDGADVVQFAEAGKGVEIKDFSASDVVASTAAFSGAINTSLLASDGKFSVGSAIVDAVSTSDVYTVNVATINSGKATTTTTYLVGAKDKDVTMDGSGQSVLTFYDARKAKTAAVTVGSNAKGDVVNAADAGTTTVTLSGKNAVSIEAANSTDAKLVLDFAKKGSSASIGSVTDARADSMTAARTVLVAGDTLVFHAGKLSDIDITDAGLTNNNIRSMTSLSAAFATDTNTIDYKVSFDGEASDAKTLRYGKSLTDTTDDALFYGSTTDASITSAVDKATVDLGDTTKYKNLHKLVATGSDQVLRGTTENTASIDASAAKGNVNIWAGGASLSTVTLNATDAAATDTVWITDTDKTTNIVNFGTNDKFLFTDAKNLEQIRTLSVASTGAGQASIAIADVSGSTHNVSLTSAAVAADTLLVNVGGSDKKIATDLSAAKDGATYKITVATDADLVMGGNANGEGDAKKYTAVYGNAYNQTDAKLLDLSDDKFFVNVANVDASAATGSFIIRGSKSAASNIHSGAGTNNIWGQSADDDTITLLADEGTDSVWYNSAQDGNDTVTNFQADQDKVVLYNTSDAKSVYDNYTVSVGASAASIAAANGNAQLQLTENPNDASDVKWSAKAGTVTLTTLGGDVKVAAGTNMTFASDTSLYYGTGSSTLTASADVTSGTYLFDFGGASEASYYTKGVTSFDASASTAAYVLRGGNLNGASLTGGKSTNHFWGGGAYSQTMTGNNSATDYFWFGSTDGNDTAAMVGSEDYIMLYDATSVDDLKLTVSGDMNATLTVGGTANLTINAADRSAFSSNGLTFMLQTGETYSYDTATGTLKAKAAK